MKLHFAPASPYARKVRAFVIEAGLQGRVEENFTNPWASEDALLRDNPLSKVPTLVTDDGEALFDSPFICEYLDSLHDGPRLFPETGPDRWRALRLQALADGILDASVARVVESRRPEAQRSADWDARQKAAKDRALGLLERRRSELDGPRSIGQVAVGCALGYLDFRMPNEDWRAGHSGLRDWYAGFSQRLSMTGTEPYDPQ